MLRTFLGYVLLFLPILTWAQSDDQNSSPYFVVSSPEEGEMTLPLKHTEAEVNIAGTIADVRITQVYQNTGEIPLEAIYVFPASTRAAVYAMEMKIGDREIEAKIKEKQAARETYEQAKANGQTASLLEQHRPNVFQMNVANILPGDSIVLHLSYTELLIPKEGIYEFVYPTVVGPRYVRPEDLQAGTADYTSNPTTKQGELHSYTFGFQGRVAGGVPVQNLNSPSHDIDVEVLENGVANFKLSPDDSKGGNRDLVFRYTLKGESLQSGMLTYQEKGEKFFLWTVQPPARVQPESITAREYIFVVDVSGSMHGFPLDITKELMQELIGGLKETDRFNVILFAAASSIMDEQSSVPATPENIQRALTFIAQQQGGGGTSLLPALERGLRLKDTPGYSRSFVLCTDGYVTVEDEAYDLVRDNLGEANFFAFGMGTSVNRAIIEGLAEVGQGEEFVAMSSQESKQVAKQFQTYIEAPILTDIYANFGEMDVYDIEPIGIPDVFSDRPIVIHGKFKGKLNGQAVLKGISGDQPYEEVIELSHIKPQKENRALRYLWARERIHRLSDVRGAAGAESSQQEVTDLGLQYNLLTRYTSFVAVDKKKRNDTGQDTTIRQTLPLPEGVSDRALQNSPTYSSHYAAPITGAIAGVEMSYSYSVSHLEEVVVVGYGTTGKTDVSSAISSMEPGNFYMYDASSPIQGWISGVQVTRPSGAPGLASAITIRGNSSAFGSIDPLYVIDGVVQEAGFTLQGAGGNVAAPSFAQQLSPEEIEEITILRSSDATAIYGARASNGVILISTQKPKPYKPRWTWNSRLGLNSLPGRSRTQAENIPYGLRIGVQQDHLLRFQQKWEKQSLYASLRQRQDQGLIKGGEYDQLALRLRYDRRWGEKWRTELAWRANQAIQRPLLLDWMGLDSLANTEFDSQPGFYETFDARIRSRQMQGRAKVRGEILPWLRWTSEASWQGSWIVGDQYAPVSLWGSSDEEGFRMNSEIRFSQLQHTHQLSFLPSYRGDWEYGGHLSWQQLLQQWDYTGAVAYGVEPDQPMEEAKTRHNLALSLPQTIHLLGQQAFVEWKEMIRTNLSLSWGNMRQGDNGLAWRAFPAASLKLTPPSRWIPGDFLASSINLSYTEMGSNRLPLYAFGSQTGAMGMGNPFGLNLSMRRLPIDNLDWEVSREWNAGLKLDFWNYRVSITQNFYRKITQDFWAELPRIMDEGLFWQVQNVGDVLQKGSETAVEFNLHQVDWRFNLGGNVTFQQNRILRLSEPNGIQTGLFHPLSGDFVEVGKLTENQPLMAFEGHRLDDQGQPLSDPEILGSAMPTFFFGTHAEVSYKYFSLFVKAYGAKGQSVLNLNGFNGQQLITEDMVEDADFLRLSDIQFNATVPTQNIKWLQQLKLSAGMSNVFVWTKYSGFDPEVNVLGQQNPVLMGVDAAAYPRARGIWLGIEIGIK